MSDSQPASPGVQHTPNHDSMVTVSLSDIQSSSEHTQPDWRSIDIPPTPVELAPEYESEPKRSTVESLGPMPLQDAAKTTFVPTDGPPTPTLADHQKTTEDEEIDDNDVDWENLEKTEEQEPRGEGSDDVSWLSRTFLPHSYGMEN